eukprot:TRINITY_DN10210_c0_g1_i2.p1 TRINITY_DN10210_c0_g1~~TRINITY_DN10210_c0_g1_i2.p1  ORF type:complete len:225 (-),score=32.04 TRINITY_DN10210_c0_g1_i2:371-1045(-)
MQCKETGKPIFVSGFGMQILVYYCATAYAPLNFIDDKGSTLDSLLSLDPNISNGIFLDSSTGDYYERDVKKGWVAMGNTGLHYSQSLEGGELVNSKRGLIRPRNDTSLHNILYINNNHEQITVIKKLYLQHWVVRDLPPEFKVYSRNTWDPHPVNIQSAGICLVRSNYRVLAESARGPQIAVHEDSVCVQFDVLPRYAESVVVLFGFLQKYMRDAYVSFALIGR